MTGCLTAPNRRPMAALMMNSLVTVVLCLNVIIDAFCAWAISKKDTQIKFILDQAKSEREELRQQFQKENSQLLLTILSKETAIPSYVDDKDSVPSLDDYISSTNFFPELRPDVKRVDVDER